MLLKVEKKRHNFYIPNNINSIRLKESSISSLKKSVVMKEKRNPDNDCIDQSEEYFDKKIDSEEHESKEYYPPEQSVPPHY